MLRKIASRLLSVVRDEDQVCRIGGDEFLVLMTDTDAAVAGRVAERIRQAITDSPIPTRDGSMPVSLSVGFTVRPPNDPTPAETLIERADQAPRRRAERHRPFPPNRLGYDPRDCSAALCCAEPESSQGE